MNIETPIQAQYAAQDVGPEPAAGADNEAVFSVDFRSIIFLIRRNILLIIAVIGIAVVLGFVATMLTTPRYIASAQVQIDQEADRILDDRNAVQPEVQIQDADRFLHTQTDVLNSRTMSLRVARSLNLLGNKAFFDAMRAPLPATSGRLAPAKAVEEATLSLLQKNLQVTLPRESRVVSISFESPDPDLAARIANSYAREYIAYNLQRKFNSSAYAREFLSGQLAAAKTRLEASERALNDYARAAGLIRTGSTDTDAQGRSRPSESITSASLVQLNQAALQARADRIAAEGKWRAVAGAAPLTIPEVLANPAISALLQQRATTQAALQQERARHLDDHPTVKQLTAQLEENNNQLTSLANQIKSSVNEQYKSAISREQQLDQQVSRYKSASLEEQSLGVRYGILSRETDTNRVLYDGLLQRFKEVSAAAGISANNISIVDDATAPIVPSSPKLFVNLALALLIGAAVAAAIVMIREQLDDVIRVPEDVENKLALPVLGSIPVQDTDLSIVARLDQPRSQLSEAYNALRTAILYSTTQGLPHSLAITSTQAGEGKTTTSYALSRSLAKLDKRVVLISADLRRPSMHHLLELENTHGLTDALTSTGSVLPLLMDTPFENLSFMASGPVPPNPTELLGSARMREVMDELSSRFDVVIIDGPPVLGLADAPILSVIAKATIFVIESDRGSRGATKSALRRLRTAHANIIGTVLTKLDTRKVGQYYGYYNYEYYSYGEDTAPARPRRFLS